MKIVFYTILAALALLHAIAAMLALFGFYCALWLIIHMFDPYA